MNKTVELVNLWAEYESSHKNASITDFFRYRLIHDKENAKKGFLAGVVPPDAQSIMAKLIGRIAKLHLAYASAALKEVGIANFEDFTFLNSIYKMDNPKKTAVIYQNFNELSSGLLVIERLKKAGFITEVGDKTDKRSRLLKLTLKGNESLLLCYDGMKHVNEMFFNDLPEDDLQLCIHLLTPLEIKFAGHWQSHKLNEFEKNYEAILGKKIKTTKNKKAAKK